MYFCIFNIFNTTAKLPKIVEGQTTKMTTTAKEKNKKKTKNKKQRTKGQTTICKTLHRKLKIKQHEQYSL
jgi:hypothetical protein